MTRSCSTHLTHDRLDTGGLRFVHQLEDIETLNGRATRGELEVSAVSIHAFAYLADRYALLASGASMGDRYGPTLVTREPMTLGDLRGANDRDTGQAHLGLSDAPALHGQRRACQAAAVRSDTPRGRGRRRVGWSFDPRGAAYYGDGAYTRCSTWDSGGMSKPSLPLPLGGNVVRKDLGPALVLKIAGLLKQSIRYALEHREEALGLCACVCTRP